METEYSLNLLCEGEMTADALQNKENNQNLSIDLIIEAPVNISTDCAQINDSENVIKDQNKKLIIDNVHKQLLFDESTSISKMSTIDNDFADDVNVINKEISSNQNDDNSDDDDFIIKDTKLTKNKFSLIDTDDESEIDVNKIISKNSDINSSIKNDNTEANKKKISPLELFDTDSSVDEVIHKTHDSQNEIENSVTFETGQTKKQKLLLNALCDSESSEDETQINNDEQNDFKSLNFNYKSIAAKSRKNKSETVKKMTGKDAVEQRRQITSEKQRMVRETSISLPYHKAKSHSLQEFMSKRSKLHDVIRSTRGLPNHMNIKMSNEQLELVAKKLEEREKELDEFYKSSTESEEENEKEIEKNNLDENIETEKIQSTEICDKDDLKDSIKSDNFKEITCVEKNNENEQIKNYVEKEINKIDEIKDKLIDNNTENKNIEDEILKLIDKNNEIQEIIKEKYADDIEIIETIDNPDEKLIEQKLNAPQKGNNKIVEKLKKINPLLLKKTNFQPHISGNSKDVIILDDDIDKSRGINELKKRFIAHNTMKPVHTKDENDIARIDSNVLKHESAKVFIDHDDETRLVELKPGAKFKKLRHELEVQMAKKRWEQWEKTQKQNVKNSDDNVYEGEKDECGNMEIDEEEEEEMTESESSEDEYDVEIKEKPIFKSAFVDEEAEEESDGENNADNEESDSDEDDDDEKIVEDVSFNQKKTKRILNTFSDDSADENSNSDSLKTSKTVSNIIKSLDNHEDNLPVTDDEEIPLYQQENLNKTPIRIQTQSKSDLNLTPTLCLTALQGMASTSKRILHESPGISLSLPSPLKRNTALKTKLFQSNDGDSLSQAFDELEELCSGKFTDIPVTQDIKINSQEEEELLDVISGKFDGNLSEEDNKCDDSSTKINNNKILPTKMDNIDLTNGNSSSESPKIISVGKAKDFQIDLTSDSAQNLHFDFNCDDSQDIRLTLDDNSPNKIEPTVGAVKGKLVLISSDDEVEEIESPKKNIKNKKKKLDFSDDDLSDIEKENNNEVPSDDEFNKEYTELTSVQDINYDSEENEIDFAEEIVMEKVTKTFFEAEAELSESDWGSADEDEKGLDELEIEDGDADQFNEKKLQNELGRIHMRQVLDEDNREVRILQELLLEDGELHGVGREKKFKWKNAESMTWNETDQPREDDEEADEIESEMQWRKMRHEREIFLEEQRKKAMETSNEIELLTNDSQIMQLGKEALKKSLESTPKLLSTEITKHETFSLLNKRSFRGSFLARSENTLTRLAEMTKIVSKEMSAGIGAKNSRNFVFTSVDKNDEIADEGDENSKKRKALDGTPKVLKKMRISENSPSGVKSKKSLKPIFSQS